VRRRVERYSPLRHKRFLAQDGLAFAAIQSILTSMSPRFERTLEDELRDCHRSNDLTRMAKLAIEHYGPELLRFACSIMRSADRGEEAFSQACERIWVGLPGFRFDSSFRSWAFAIVRHQCFACLKNPYEVRRLGLSALGPLSEVEGHVRTVTSPALRTETRDRLHSLRAILDPDEQALLELRVDRKLSWPEVVIAMSEPDVAMDDRELRRAEAALRKRFERLKQRLREQAKREGLLEP
jgi:RNA polymerase sigma-70 factor (ECF subfamily)